MEYCGTWVPDVPTYNSEDEQISWKSSDEEDDDEESMSKDDDDNADDDQNDDNADNEADDDQNDDNADNEGDNDQDDENEQTESDNDDDDFVHPKLSTFDEKERQDKEDKEEEWSDDVTMMKKINERRDTEMADANVQATQVIEDTHVIITTVTLEVQQQSSSVSSGFISDMLIPNPDTGIDSILNLNTESTSLVDVPVTTNVELPP
ncbi:hypothetical protein Tco_1215846 [Tanacetum coccineum]